MRLSSILWRTLAIATWFLLVMLGADGRTAPMSGETSEECSESRGAAADQDDSQRTNARHVLTSEGRGRLVADNGIISPYWERDGSSGKLRRMLARDGSYLAVEVNQQSGGFDTAVLRSFPETRVDDIRQDVRVAARIDAQIDVVKGKWWAGPKCAVRTPGSRGLTGNYENYVVENCSVAPDEYHAQRLSSIERKGGAYLGTTTQDGSTYRHYRIKHKEWEQFWAVRQDYRTSGAVSMKPIFEMWRKNGLPNQVVTNIRINIETSGEMKGQVRFTDLAFPEKVAR